MSYISRYEISTNGSKSDQFVAHLNFGDDNLKAHALSHIDYMGLHPNVTVEADINDFKVNVTIGKDSDGNAKVIDMKSDGLKHIKVHFLGPFGNMDPMANSFEENIILRSKPLITELFDKISKEVLGKTFQTI